MSEPPESDTKPTWLVSRRKTYVVLGAIAVACVALLVVFHSGGRSHRPAGGTRGGVVPKAHRATSAICAPSVRPTRSPNPSFGGCHSDADCREHANGRCVAHSGGTAVPRNACEYDECSTDRDCSDEQDPPEQPLAGPCVCGEHGAVNSCAIGNCKTDADCSPGYCSPSPHFTCDGYVAWFCHTLEDECVNDADCTGKGAECRYDVGRAHWRCETGVCVY